MKHVDFDISARIKDTIRVISLLALTVLFAPTAYTQTLLIINDSNRLLGIQELQVGADRFDVTFAAGQYDDAFTANGLTPAFIGNESAATAATFAIFDAINADGRFVDLPQNIGGCSDLVFLECGIQIPFNGPYATGFPSTPFAVDVWTAFYGGNGLPDGVFSQSLVTSGLGLIDTVTWAIFTPSNGGSVEEVLADLVATVVELNINAGVSNALDSKVQNAIDALDRAQTGDSSAAIGILYAFIQSVDAQRDKSISSSDADDLVAKATAIIGRLEES